MTPYQTPESGLDAGSLTSESFEIGNPENDPFYDHVLKMVLWGESRDDVFRSMEVGGVMGGRAQSLYDSARKERTSSIRSVYFRRLLLGGGLMLIGVIVFIIFWFGIGVIPRVLLYGCFAIFGIGVWKGIDGVAGYLMAHNKEGSVADEF